MVSWHAVFRDGSRLDQFDNDGNEISFGAVKKRFNDLKALSIHLGERLYTVSLLDGMFNVGGKCMYVLDTNIYPPDKLENIRPIYFERWQQDFSVTSGQPLGQRRLFVTIGFQATFEGKNVKRYLEVYDSGDCKIREK